MKDTPALLMTVGLWLGAMLSAAIAASPEGTDLPVRFLHPPEEAKPWVYWFVMDGNLRREGITADLEAMKRVGIGGLLFMEVDVGIPKGPMKFMSPPWRELFKHANQEAARLGLQITMPASPGWTGSGGPWVKPEQSMQKLVSSEMNLSGPQRFHGRVAAAGKNGRILSRRRRAGIPHAGERLSHRRYSRESALSSRSLSPRRAG